MARCVAVVLLVGAAGVGILWMFRAQLEPEVLQGP
jgi:hypothetical protein